MKFGANKSISFNELLSENENTLGFKISLNSFDKHENFITIPLYAIFLIDKLI
jgi:hypothetical protein